MSARCARREMKIRSFARFYKLLSSACDRGEATLKIVPAVPTEKVEATARRGSFLSLAADPSLQSRARGRVSRFWVLAPCIAYLQPPELPLKFLSQLLIAGGIWGTQPLDWTVPARKGGVVIRIVIISSA